ncbi:hypothetical protein [Streptomyces sp. NRRL S-118]|uniref:hypothetical protein n=1 Tax=Streptomyces sp. NRRL S-118 TaxID=1463881 RepID=UPI001F1E16DA|nr:hypothetical protein [Streptomyces sp. NRRL S-118]
MNPRTQLGMGMFVTALASAASAALATPAAAAPTAPVDVPLQTLGMVLPMAPPTVSTGVPIPMTGTPMGLTAHTDGRVQPLLVPQVPVTSGMPETLITATLPEVVEDQPVTRALLSTPESDVNAKTPGAKVASPLTLPRPAALGLPAAQLPEAGLLSPALSGSLGSHLGMDGGATN